MDSVLEIPISAVDEISEIPLEYFVSMLNKGDYLISSGADYVQEILNVPDVTYSCRIL